MARKRSPNYPAVGLPEAIERIRAIHDAEHQNPAAPEVMAQHLGYSGINGASLKLLSALSKYGLLEKAGDGELQVSDRAIDILFPEGDQRKLAIEAAATSPVLFSNLREKWPNRLPSDENLRAHLIRRQFAQSAISDVIRTFRETFDLVARESGQYDTDSEKSHDEGESAMQQPQTLITPSQTPPPVPSGDSMRVSITSSGLEVVAHLVDVQAIDKLIRTLQATKILYEPVQGAFDTEYTDDEEGREAAKLNEEIDGDE